MLAIYFDEYFIIFQILREKGWKLINNKSKHKSDKLWVYHGREFYNNLMQKLLNDNDISSYLTHNEGKKVVAEGFIRTLKG